MKKFKSVTMKNFGSVGNVTQAVNLDEHGLTLILGENLDQGSSGSRNGVGKTTLIQAICYAIYGLPLTNIKRDNLINKVNQKGMSVSLEIEDGNKTYRIERGRKPNYLRFFVNDGLVTSDGSDEAHGESKITQAEIERVVGMSHLLFKYIMALLSKTVPFLDLNAKDQRLVIEELMGITLLSQKAEALKELIKQTKDEIKSEEMQINVRLQSNERAQAAIKDLKFKAKLWDGEHEKKINKLQRAIDQMNEIDIDAEIANMRILADFNILQSEVNRLSGDTLRAERMFNNAVSALSLTQKQLEVSMEHKCHTCGQDVHDEQHQAIITQLNETIAKQTEEVSLYQDELIKLGDNLTTIVDALKSLGEKPKVVYDNMEQALNHRHTLDKLMTDLGRESSVINPYIDQIANLNVTSVHEISYDILDNLVKTKEHQEYLQRILTDKNSFIRKKIIDQNLSYLNVRLNSYLDKLGLPHEVVFQSDLSVEIMNRGKEYDFAQLSNGEQNRLVLSLAWSFRDVWETMNSPINLLLIDELVDTGMDSQGMDNALALLKKAVRDRNKNIFIISHKDELVSRVPNVLLVQKENDFTTFSTDTEITD